jgi:hypothetical protein
LIAKQCIVCGLIATYRDLIARVKSSRSTSYLSTHLLPLSLSLSLSQGEKDFPCRDAFTFDLGQTEGIPSLTVTSSTISSGYFIDSSPF